MTKVSPAETDLTLRSSQCPLGQKIDATTAMFAENLVHLMRGDFAPEKSARFVVDSLADYEDLYGEAKKFALQACARTIADDKCPLWRYDPDTNGLVPKGEPAL